jgi:hypothetical protein
LLILAGLGGKEEKTRGLTQSAQRHRPLRSD